MIMPEVQDETQSYPFPFTLGTKIWENLYNGQTQREENISFNINIAEIKAWIDFSAHICQIQ